MDYLPVCLDLRAAPVLLVGGGEVAARKAVLLKRAGARITVVSPTINDQLRALLETGGHHIARPYQSSDMPGFALVVAATGDEALNAAVAADAKAQHTPVNVVDAPELCSFIFPAIVDRNPVLVAVSSSGQSPVIARAVRRQIEALLPANYGRLASFMGRLRQRVKAHFTGDSATRRFMEQTADGAAAELVLAGREAEAEALVEEQLNQNSPPQGEAYLIGAGPGDPDLMTFKAVRLLQKADVVLYDRLVSAPILELSRRDAERIYVGKARAQHAVPQSDINQMLVDLALQGKCVARLKGGDPFIFGRGGEEIDLLAQQGIPFQVVPGITAASGAACYAGIPLTHRDYAQSVRFVAGYLKGDRVVHDWASLCRTDETLVFYMGLVGLAEISRQLIAHGRNASTPVAVVERGTLDDQRVICGRLQDIAARVEREAVRGPTLIIVGEVVQLHSKLSWFGA
jgi:uroporphyrin-III C-methyltransferase/precorrin-2 dehydrogenase/sirohydrochlorin ferrochelatase